MARKIYFSIHSRDRCLEHGLDFSFVKNGYKYAQNLWAPGEVMKRNKMWHPSKARCTIYKWWNGVLYTVLRKGCNDIILTVTPKKREDIKFSYEHQSQ